MPIGTSLRPALLGLASLATLALTITLTVTGATPATAVDTQPPDLPTDTNTEVTHVAAATATLKTKGVPALTSPVGFGAATTGGARGHVIHVRNAQDSYDAPTVGSLRW